MFTCDLIHPNIYADGRVCISILHAPGDDPTGYETSAERWSPVQVRSWPRRHSVRERPALMSFMLPTSVHRQAVCKNRGFECCTRSLS